MEAKDEISDTCEDVVNIYRAGPTMEIGELIHSICGLHSISEYSFDSNIIVEFISDSEDQYTGFFAEILTMGKSDRNFLYFLQFFFQILFYFPLWFLLRILWFIFSNYFFCEFYEIFDFFANFIKFFIYLRFFLIFLRILWNFSFICDFFCLKLFLFYICWIFRLLWSFPHFWGYFCWFLIFLYWDSGSSYFLTFNEFSKISFSKNCTFPVQISIQNL